MVKPWDKNKQYQYILKKFVFLDIIILYICDLFEPDGSTITFEQWLHQGLTHRDFLIGQGCFHLSKKTSKFLQNTLNT